MCLKFFYATLPSMAKCNNLNGDTIMSGESISYMKGASHAKLLSMQLNAISEDLLIVYAYVLICIF